MSDYDSRIDTMEHIEEVRRRLHEIENLLRVRGLLHDESKLSGLEKDAFDVATPKLRGLTYGSDEYRAALREINPAIKVHYAENRHHPEHFENGIDGMNLLDVVEMFCDWKAATMRHADGDLSKSLEHNVGRFGISPQLASILKNTIETMAW